MSLKPRQATKTGNLVAWRTRRVIPESDDEEPMPMGSCAGLDDELSALELDTDRLVLVMRAVSIISAWWRKHRTRRAY